MAGEGFLGVAIGLGVASRIQEKEDWVIEGRGMGRADGGGFEGWVEEDEDEDGGAVRVTLGAASEVGESICRFVGGREMGLWVGESGGEGPFPLLLFSVWERPCSSVSGCSED